MISIFKRGRHYQRFDSLGMVQTYNHTCKKNVDKLAEKDIKTRKDLIWRTTGANLNKLPYGQRRLFRHTIETDGVGASVTLNRDNESSDDESSDDETNALPESIKNQMIGDEYAIIAGIDTGAKLTWAGAKMVRCQNDLNNMASDDYEEENFEISAKEYHKKSKFAYRLRKQRKQTKSFDTPFEESRKRFKEEYG